MTTVLIAVPLTVTVVLVLLLAVICSLKLASEWFAERRANRRRRAEQAVLMSLLRGRTTAKTAGTAVAFEPPGGRGRAPDLASATRYPASRFTKLVP